MRVKAALKTDANGFVSQESACCNELFKVVFNKGSKKPIAHCPYCGLHTQSWTIEQMDYLDCVAENYHPSRRRKPPCHPPVEREKNWEEFTFECCKDKIQYVGSPDELFCIVCGKPHDV